MNTTFKHKFSTNNNTLTLQPNLDDAVGKEAVNQLLDIFEDKEMSEAVMTLKKQHTLNK